MTAHEKSSSDVMTSIERAAAGNGPTLLMNASNFYYTGPLYFGTGLTKMTLIFDTGSPELTMNISTCTTCKGPKYDCTGCTFTGINKTTSYYDGTSYTGERCKTKTCPINSATACIPTFQFLCIKQSNDASTTIAGILGLGRKGTSYDGEYYMDELFKAGVISSKEFSISFDTFTNNSYIDYGPADKT
jgi:hypothetical protein